MINNVNGNQLDDDLKFIVDAILELHFSIKYCEQIENDTIRSSGFKDSYRHQLKIISYYTTILKDFRWFQELKKMNKHFNYLEEKKTLIEKINQSTV